MPIENLTSLAPINQLLVSYQSLIGIMRIALGGLFGLAFIAFLMRFFQDMRIMHYLRIIKRDIADIQERLDGFEAKEEPVDDNVTTRDHKKKKSRK